jgi:hypothetical protein
MVTHMSTETLDKTFLAATEKRRACEEVGNAVDTGGVGEIVTKHEKLILQYYEDVQRQAKQSFGSAKSVAYMGFCVLIATLTYTLLFDALSRIQISGLAMSQPSRAVASIGVVSGALIEFIAGINFWLYSRASRQFGAFHICLERTHRYLVAYKIAGEIGAKKDETLEKLVCIMANAPMITHQDIEAVGSKSGMAKFLPEVGKN